MPESAETSVPPIGTQLTRLAQRHPDRPAVTCDGVMITRAELEASSNRLARAYRELGVRQGDYVSVVLPNSIEWLQAAFATWKLGAILQPLPTGLPAAEFDELLRLVPRALLVGREDPSGAIPSVPPGFTPASDLSAEPLQEAVSPAWQAMASGGSTGRPKLIETPADRIDAARTMSVYGFREDGTQLVPGPLAHNTSFVAMMHGLLLGAHIVLMPRFDPDKCLKLIGEHGVHFMTAVPTMMRRMLPVYQSRPEAYDLSSLERLWHMAEPCPPSVKQAWIDMVGPEVVWELYGGSEQLATTMLSGTEWLAHRGSVGRVVLGQMKVLDDSGEECPVGTVGEVFMRPGEGAGPTYRYIGAESAADADGWDTIGDLGWFDADGYLFLSDRRVDMFNVAGRKVYPAEIEVALLEHPAVLSCLAVGVPDDDLGQVPFVLVEAQPGADIDDDAVESFLAERLAYYKVPRFVEFRTEPLRDDMGKARRSAVRAEILARTASASVPQR